MSSSPNGDPRIISVKAFSIERVIGQGGFGKVNAVIKHSDKKWYAMKTLTKKVVVDQKNITMLMNERDLLIELKDPWLCNMHHAFQDPLNCYLVMDLCLGGDLRFHLNKIPSIYTEEACKFYMACNLLALKYLHGVNCLHRDIKPDNMLLDSEGYLKLTDLGISSKMVNGECDKRSGTKPYMAYELLNKTPHGIPSDLYSLTIVLYELLMKSRPFKDATDGQAINPANSVNLVKCSDTCKSFMIKGLARDCKERFQTVDEMMTHKWYEGFDFEALKNRTMKVPFKPNIDVANCDTGTNDLNDAFGVEEDKPKIADKDQELFKNYDYNTGKEAIVTSGESKAI